MERVGGEDRVSVRVDLPPDDFDDHNLIAKHFELINLVHGNLLYRTIFISNMKVNVQ